MRRILRLFDCSRNGGPSALAERVRSDARRNREKLLEVATAAFAAADGRSVSLVSSARDAARGWRRAPPPASALAVCVSWGAGAGWGGRGGGGFFCICVVHADDVVSRL